MNAAALSVDRHVARRFDEAQERFKASLSPNDYRLEAILAALPSLTGRRVLDLGCGKGRFARALKTRGAEVVGLDVSLGMLRSARDLATVQGSLNYLPFVQNSFDAVLVVETLQHVAALRSAITEAYRVLKPGGKLVVVDKHRLALNADRPWIPNTVIKWIDEARGRGMYLGGDRASERWFTAWSLCSVMKQSGFEEVASAGLVSPQERGRPVFERQGWTRAMRIWEGVKPVRVPA